MKRSEFASLLRHPLLQMEGFVLRGTLLFKPPVDRLLRGFCFESSQLDRRAFYATFFVMPLCVPSSHLHFTFGDRVRRAAGGDRWNAEMPDLAAELATALKRAAVFLSEIESLLAFVAYAESLPRTERNLEGVGYALARAGHVAQAIATFDELLERVDMTVPWQRELAGRISNLKHTLIKSPENARCQLVSFERETIQSLGLDEFRDA